MGRIALSISKSAYDWFITRQWGKEFHTPQSRRRWAGIEAHKTSAKEASSKSILLEWFVRALIGERVLIRDTGLIRDRVLIRDSAY